MVKFKCFEGTSSLNLEEQVNLFLKENSDLLPVNVQMCVTKYNTLYLGIMFQQCVKLPPAFGQTVTAPLPMPQQISGDDPWRGEFIPLGDPPMDVPKMEEPPCPSRRRFQVFQGKAGIGRAHNISEQFGGGIAQ